MRSGWKEYALVPGRRYNIDFSEKAESETSYSELPLQADAFENLCRRAGLCGPLRLDHLAAGRNNRLFRLAGDGRVVVVKIYFYHPCDSRDRLKQEFGFLEYLWCRGVRNVPRPIWADYQHHLGVYEFVSGRPLSLEEIGPRHVEQAINFYRRINIDKQAFSAQALPPASEACFSIAEHLACVDRRIERLGGITVRGELDQAAREFVEFEIVPMWSEIRERAASEFRGEECWDAPLSRDARCLSPSDFGFHNTLIDDSGTLCFLDFEYAGWDDPAKLVCDFGNQPDLLLPEDLSLRFRSAVSADDPAPEHLARRINCLAPVYQIKWSCIILNEFLREGRDHAFFLGRCQDGDTRKKEQLEKARKMLKRAEATFEGTGLSNLNL